MKKMIALLVLLTSEAFAAEGDVVERSRATYAALKTYADTGIIDVEYGSRSGPSRDRHTFVTYFRSPRHYFFEFTKLNRVDRGVIWSDENAFYTWWQSNGVVNEYGKGRGASAFVMSTSPMYGSATHIAPWLFPQAGLVGTLVESDGWTDAGFESVGARKCHKLTGIARSLYSTGHVTNVRKVTVWIDAETLLVRKVFQDSPKGTPVSLVSRTTITFVPRANPALEDKHFAFAPPEPPQ